MDIGGHGMYSRGAVSVPENIYTITHIFLEDGCKE